MSLLLRGGTLVTRDAEGRVLQGNLYAEGGRVREIGGPDREADTVLDGRGCYVLPGLVNGFLRGHHLLLGPPRDLDAHAAAQRASELEDRMTKRDLGLATALALAEGLRSGVTCVLNLSPWADEAARAATQVGVRGLLAYRVRDGGELKGCRSFLWSLRSWEGVTPLVGLEEATDPDLLREVEALAREAGVRWCFPLGESRAQVHAFRRATGRRPGEWLEAEGLLSSRLVALHAVWLTRSEIRALGRAGASVVHCPAAAGMTGAGGLTPLPELLEEGVPVALGTDAPFRSGRWDPFHLLRLVGLLHKGDRWDPTLLPATTLLSLATDRGAQALGWEGGRLVVGAPADVVVVAPWPGRGPSPEPAEAAARLVYEADVGWVRHVVVAGRLVVTEGRTKTLDLEALRADVAALRRELGAGPGD